MVSKKSVSVIVPAAGSGSRLQSKTPKPYVMMQGKPLVVRTLEALHNKVKDRIETLVAVEPAAVNKMSRIIAKYGIRSCRVVEGGSTRAESVRKSFFSLSSETKIVLIHDAARPFLKREPIEEAISAAEKTGAAILAKSADATVKEVKPSSLIIGRTIDRSRVYLAQTPQVFTSVALRNSYRRVGSKFKSCTDEAALLEAAGMKVRVIAGSAMNFKITNPEDLDLAKLMIKFRLE
ncbi:MAG: 2-C-methyl-D-erythritol 4-phosphate cytidylyltransferase [Candidatus Omnitrophica bacterium]|nr:2-C-methyl-D-erythritol 4-phosphate cytidylyltransferase [Candidatus Omnitrophota bacterium]